MATEHVRSAEPINNTVHNLIHTLNSKLDAAARYGLYQEDATKDGFDDCADLFARLAETEQENIQALLGCLRDHIGEA